MQSLSDRRVAAVWPPRRRRVAVVWLPRAAWPPRGTLWQPCDRCVLGCVGRGAAARGRRVWAPATYCV